MRMLSYACVCVPRYSLCLYMLSGYHVMPNRLIGEAMGSGPSRKRLRGHRGAGRRHLNALALCPYKTPKLSSSSCRATIVSLGTRHKGTLMVRITNCNTRLKLAGLSRAHFEIVRWWVAYILDTSCKGVYSPTHGQACHRWDGKPPFIECERGGLLATSSTVLRRGAAPCVLWRHVEWG